MRKAAVLAIAVLLAQVVAPATCVGWEGDAAARKACCQRAHHEHCHDQAAADDCCAKHESASMGTLASAATTATVTQTASVAVPLFATLMSSSEWRGHHSSYLARPRTPPHLNSPPLRR